MSDAARYARIPVQSLRNWVRGYGYFAGGRRRRARSVITPPKSGGGTSLSFINLVEVLSLSGFRSRGISMQKLRRALEYVGQEMKIDHPLASERILTDGVELFWEYQERWDADLQVVNIVRGGQKVFPEVVVRYLREIEWGSDSFASKWWPDARRPGEGVIVVDPRRAFGSPVIAGTGIRTEDVFLRFSAGETLAELADDFGLTFEQTEAAVRAQARLLEPQAA